MNSITSNNSFNYGNNIPSINNEKGATDFSKTGLSFGSKTPSLLEKKQIILDLVPNPKYHKQALELLDPKTLQLIDLESIEEVKKLKFHPITHLPVLNRSKLLLQYISSAHKFTSAPLFQQASLADMKNITNIANASPEFDFFISGHKPGVYLYNNQAKSIQEFATKTPDVDFAFDTIMINKKQAKEIIAQNKSVFCNRIGCPNSVSIDEIYESLLHHNPKSSDDIIGMLLGYPPKSSIVYNLRSFIHNNYNASYISKMSQKTNPELVENFKTDLRRALHDVNSPYKNADKKLIKEIEDIIDKVNGVTFSSNVVKNSDILIPFISFLPEPEATKKIAKNISKYLRRK